MSTILTSPIFWHGCADIIVILAVIFRKPNGLLDALARRQLFQSSNSN